MKDVIYAGFAQLSYLDWHKLPEIKKKEDKKISVIFKKYFNIIRTAKEYNKMYPNGKDYLRKENEKKIYSSEDARIFMLYSEDEIKAEQNHKYPEFGEWEFICGYDHKKIYNEMPIKTISAPEDFIFTHDLGFQASAFKRGNEIIVAYRGTNEGADWIYANPAIFLDGIPQPIICSVWFFNKIKKMYPNYKIYITGHSMGGALAQFTHLYFDCENETRTWNALGVEGMIKFIFEFNRNIRKAKSDIYNKIIKNSTIVDKKNKIINYYMNYDLTAHLKNREGKVICVDDEYVGYDIDFTGTIEGNKRVFLIGKTIFTVKYITKTHVSMTNGVSRYHSVINFLPFINENGNLTSEVFSKNYIQNSIKTFVKNRNFLSKIKKEDDKKIIYKEISKKIKKADEMLFFYLLEKNIKKCENNWYVEIPNGIQIGAFNNCSDIGGVIGGIAFKVPYKNQSNKSEKHKIQGQYHVIDGGICSLEKNANPENPIVVGNTEIGMSAAICETGENMWEERLGDKIIKYSYEDEGKKFVAEWTDMSKNV